MARYWCERCRQESNTLDPPHLCRDLERRWKRREKQADAVQAELYGKVLDGIDMRALAERVVMKLTQMGVEDDI